MKADITDLKIAVGLSGGGFRASAFNLGTLSFLDKIAAGDGTLLDNILVLSTVSGGTITGARYAIGKCKGESFKSIYKALYSFMTEVKLVDLGLERLASHSEFSNKRVHSLINAMADIYDEKLFKGERFGVLCDDNRLGPKHISFNATELDHGAQFRFQCSEKLLKPIPGEPDRGLIGNYYNRVSLETAREIRMGDIVAASSCFPLGFEPINFPTDFDLKPVACVTDENNLPAGSVGLMDGGIVDNQGVEPILLAEGRLKRNRIEENQPKPGNQNVLDLIILSDVASPYMRGYKVSIQKPENWWRRLTLGNIILLNSLFLMATLVLLAVGIHKSNVAMVLAFSALATVETMLFILGKGLRNLPSKFHVPLVFHKPLKNMLKLRLATFETLIWNRTNSVVKMVNEVFLKHVRRLNYQKIYSDSSWRNRRIMSAIYELRHGESKLSETFGELNIPKALGPSESIQKIARIASEMGTTLWFSESELAGENLLDNVIACGQFTICWNLIEYIYKIKNNDENTTHAIHALVRMEDSLIDQWKLFQADPCWLVKEYGSAMSLLLK